MSRLLTDVLFPFFFFSLPDVTRKFEEVCRERDAVASTVSDYQTERMSYLGENERLQETLATLRTSLAEAQDKCRSLLAFSLLCLAISILFMLNFNYSCTSKPFWFLPF